MRRSTSLKTIIYPTLGVIALASAALGGWGVYYLLTEKKTTNHNIGPLVEYNFAEYKTDDNGNFINKDGNITNDKTKRVVVREIPGLKIAEYKTELPDGTKDYYLDDKAVNFMVKRFFATANFGPEIFSLKKIWISKVELTSTNENGIYIPNTHEIGLNGGNSARDLYNTNWKTYNADGSTWTTYNNLIKQLYGSVEGGELDTIYRGANSYKYRAEVMFQVLMHEYGHHLASSYFSSPFETDITKTYENYDEVEATNKTPSEIDGMKNRWNANFLNEFESAFRYNQSTKPLIDSRYTGLVTNDTISVGKIYSSDQLFKLSNHDQNHKYYEFGKYVDDKGQIQTYKGLAFTTNVGFNKIPLSETKYNYSRIQLDSNKLLKYFYSSEEEFTRKQMQASLVPEETTFNAFVRNKINSDLFMDEEMYETLYAGVEDKNTIVPNIQFGSGPIRSSQYMNDNPFITNIQTNKTPAEELATSMNNYMGHAEGDNISYVWNKNGYEVIESGKMGDINQTAKTDRNMFRFGGYIDSDKYKYITFDGIDEKFPITISRFELGYKDNIFASSKHDLASSNQFFYAVNNYLDKSQVVDRRVYFEDADGNKTPLTSFRGKSNPTYGLASTYEENLPDALKIGLNMASATGKPLPNGYRYFAPKSVTNGVVFSNIDREGYWGGGW